MHGGVEHCQAQSQVFSCDDQLSVSIGPLSFFLLVSLKFFLVLKSFDYVLRKSKGCLKFRGCLK